MIASHTSANKFKFLCPVLGIERNYFEALELWQEHMKGRRPGPRIIHALMSANKDPVIHMWREECRANKALYFTTDENAPAGKPSAAVYDRVKSVIVTDRFMEFCNDEEKAELLAINDAAVPADSREHKAAAASKTAHRRGAAARAETPAPEAPKEEMVIDTGSFASAITKAAARERKETHRGADGVEREWKVNTDRAAAALEKKPAEAPKPTPAPVAPLKSVKSASAPAASAAPAPKLSLLEMARRMKTNQAA